MIAHATEFADIFPRSQRLSLKIYPRAAREGERHNLRMQYDPQKLGETIAQRQADLGLSNYQLADAIGCNERTVRNIKLGKTITLERLCLISNALGYPVWALLGEEPPYLDEIRDLLDRLRLAARSSNRQSEQIAGMEAEVREIEALLSARKDAAEG